MNSRLDHSEKLGTEQSIRVDKVDRTSDRITRVSWVKSFTGVNGVGVKSGLFT